MTHHNKNKSIYKWANSNIQTDKKYLHISPQGTSDIARKKTKLNSQKS